MILQYFFQIFQNLLRLPNTFQSDIITAVIALFVVIDPMGNIPLFIALIKKVRKRAQTVSKTTILTAGILLVILV
ncbi:MAG TPA: MarC family protein [Nitrososphaeraceae archaeon]|nr:MarC family protein [Nitrososphaeraceae archaeon]